MRENKTILAIFLLIATVTIVGLPLDLIEPDAALYATISKVIYENNDFINLYSLGKDWLDKPHLPFWLTALAYKIFGVSNFSYKIFGVLTFFFGAWITYKFTKKNYNKQIAILATLILVTAQQSVISNFDVRAEPYLTAFIIAALYWLQKYSNHKRFKDLCIAALFGALAVMTKGIFALIPIVAAIGGEYIVKRKWKEIFNPMWLVAIMLVGIFIVPELYALYVQFDLHPEKVVFDKTNVSGIKFFFWDSQFGRFFNTGPISGNGDPFFFLHTILWAFLPWALLFYIAIFLKVKRNFKIVQKQEEFYTLFGTLITLLIFSLSKFQLPHYANIVFPFMAIITADFIYQLHDKYNKLLKAYIGIQYTLMGIIVVLAILIFVFAAPEFNYILLLISAIAVYTLYQLRASKMAKHIRVFYTTCIVFMWVNGFLFTHFYPTALQYIGGATAARYINQNHNGTSLIIGTPHAFSFEFYLKNPVERTDYDGLQQHTGKILYAQAHELTKMDELDIEYQILEEINNFRISRLSGKFLHAKTRHEALQKVYVVRLK